ERPRVPRLVAGVIIGAIALASLAALVWPELPLDREEPSAVGPTRVSVIARQIEEPGAAGRIGQPAPDFEWTTPRGPTVRLSDLRGEVVVINFWATWCVPCREEMPALDRVARQERSVRFLALDLNEDGAKVRSFFDALALDHLEPVLDLNNQTARRYGVFSLPTTYFIDAQGTIRHIELGGPMNEDTVRRGIGKARAR
ncbi:MAG: TlpA family protein disulfide reductase, partial [Candidatus Limnocylindria bacterium]